MLANRLGISGVDDEKAEIIDGNVKIGGIL
jgi:hypothetical protein